MQVHSDDYVGVDIAGSTGQPETGGNLSSYLSLITCSHVLVMPFVVNVSTPSHFSIL